MNNTKKLQTRDNAAGWVESFIGKELTDFQADTVILLVRAFNRGPWNIPTNWNLTNWTHGSGVSLCVRTHSLSTYDCDHLTRLVIAAHDMQIRVEILAAGPRHIRIIMHKRRNRDGSMYERHPTIETAIDDYRQ